MQLIVYTLTVLYPPKPSLSCGHGLVTLSWQLRSENARLFTSQGTENVYANGFCTRTNGSLYRVYIYILIVFQNYYSGASLLWTQLEQYYMFQCS